MILTNSGVLKLMQRIKSYIASQLNTKAASVHTHTLSEIDDLSSLQMGGGYTKSEVDTLLNGKANSSHTHTKSQITDFPTIPSKTSDLTNDSGFLTSHQSLSNYVTLDSPQTITATKTILTDLQFSTTYTRGTVPSGAFGKNLIDYKDSAGNRICLYDCAVYTDKSSLSALNAYNTSVASGSAIGYIGIGSRADGTVFTHAPTPPTSDNSTQIATTGWAVPRSGGAVMTGVFFGRNVNNSELCLGGGPDHSNCTTLSLFGKDAYPTYGLNGALRMFIRNAKLDQFKSMYIYPSGTWTWDGTACQITSDQRLKQQIAEIDDKLLDAWEDVAPVQFKYNDAVKEKSDNARLHTGYVVQQIDEACKSHNVDISAYGLYCHEEYPERTEEVEVQQDDGTTTKETKVIEEAKEHYSLRYTETLVVECAYLRRENSRLKERLSKIEKLLNI